MLLQTSLQTPPRTDTHRLSLDIRKKIIDMSASANGAHIGGSISIADLLAVLYGQVLRNPSASGGPQDRDYLVLSKGQASAALYAVLAATGVLPEAELASYAADGSRLCGHPMKRVPGVHFSTGALGHGLPLALGTALAGRRFGRDSRSYVILGDGELQEGSNWEAAMTAQHYRLDNLVVIVDHNRIQQGDFTENISRTDSLAARWTAFGFAVAEIDGHDPAALLNRFSNLPIEPGKPTCVVARTIKGKGFSLAENKPDWHHGVPTADDLAKAAHELGIEAKR